MLWRVPHPIVLRQLMDPWNVYMYVCRWSSDAMSVGPLYTGLANIKLQNFRFLAHNQGSASDQIGQGKAWLLYGLMFGRFSTSPSARRFSPVERLRALGLPVTAALLKTGINETSCMWWCHNVLRTIRLFTALIHPMDLLLMKAVCCSKMIVVWSVLWLG